MKTIHFSIPLAYHDSVEVDDDATADAIREAIDEAVPKYVTVRVYDVDDAEYDAE